MITSRPGESTLLHPKPRFEKDLRMLDAAVKRIPRFLMDIAPIQRLIRAPGRLRLVSKADWPAPPSAVPAPPELGAVQWAELARAAVRCQEEAITLLRVWRDQGRTWPDIYLNGISPAARLMGAMWAADQMDFATVSIGSARLQAAMCELSPEFLAGARPQGDKAKRVLLANPASQHTLGSLMVAEFFRLGGWSVRVAYAVEDQNWISLVNSDWFDVLGVSISSEQQLPFLRGTLARLRQASANPSIKIMLGGPLLQDGTELVRVLQADFSAKTADEAVRLADQWAVGG